MSKKSFLFPPILPPFPMILGTIHLISATLFFPQLHHLSGPWNSLLDKAPAVVHICPVCVSEIHPSVKISDHVPSCFLKQNKRPSNRMYVHSEANLVHKLRKIIVEMDVNKRIRLAESLTRLARGQEKSDADYNALSLLFKPAQTPRCVSCPSPVPSPVHSPVPSAVAPSPIISPIPSVVLSPIVSNRNICQPFQPIDRENLKLDLNDLNQEFSKQYPKQEKMISFSNCTTPVILSQKDDFSYVPSASLKRGRDENPIIQAIPFSPRSKMLCI